MGNHIIKIEPNKAEEDPLPHGSIKMTLHKAKDLDGHWFDQGEFGKMDPYALVTFGKEKFKSNTVKNSQNPEWKYDIKFDINSETPDEVTLEVYDADVGKDDALGRATISLREIINDKVNNKWIKLEATKSGEVLFSAEYIASKEEDEKDDKLKEVDTEEKYDSEKDSKSPTPSDKDSMRKKSQGSIQSERKDSRKQSRVSAHEKSDDEDEESDKDIKVESKESSISLTQMISSEKQSSDKIETTSVKVEEKQVYDAKYEICHKTPDTKDGETTSVKAEEKQVYDAKYEICHKTPDTKDGETTSVKAEEKQVYDAKYEICH